MPQAQTNQQDQYSLSFNVFGSGLTGHTDVSFTSTIDGVPFTQTFGAQINSYGLSLLSSAPSSAIQENDGKIVQEDQKIEVPHASYTVNVSKDIFQDTLGYVNNRVGDTSTTTSSIAIA